MIQPKIIVSALAGLLALSAVAAMAETAAKQAPTRVPQIGHVDNSVIRMDNTAAPPVRTVGPNQYIVAVPEPVLSPPPVPAAAPIEAPLTGVIALYIFMLAAFTGFEIIRRVPAILHTPLMSGSNFVHGIVVVGALYALLHAQTPIQQGIGFAGVLLGAANAGGGYVVTERMLEMFKASGPKK